MYTRNRFVGVMLLLAVYTTACPATAIASPARLFVDGGEFVAKWAGDVYEYVAKIFRSSRQNNLSTQEHKITEVMLIFDNDGVRLVERNIDKEIVDDAQWRAIEEELQARQNGHSLYGADPYSRDMENRCLMQSIRQSDSGDLAENFLGVLLHHVKIDGVGTVIFSLKVADRHLTDRDPRCLIRNKIRDGAIDEIFEDQLKYGPLATCIKQFLNANPFDEECE